MSKTTEIIRRGDMPHHDLEHCHDGKGALDFTGLYSAKDAGMPTAVRFIHDDIVPPGATIGYHQHEDDEEFYFIVSGSGLMRLDDKEFQVHAGDITIVYPGGYHGLENNTDEPLHLIVIGACKQ